MNTWTPGKFNKFALAEEIEIAQLAPGGESGKPVTIWTVRLRDDLYVRSAHGRSCARFRRA